jgi:sugar phosphate isomerase/epimerase
MKLGVTSWSFPQCTLAEAAGIAKALGIDGIDVGYFYTASLDRARLLAEPDTYGAEIRTALPVAVANLYHLFGADLTERNLARGHDPQNLADLRKVLRFCKAAGAPTVFLLPGMLGPGQGRKEALNGTIEALKPMVEAGREAGVTVAIEPHVHSYVESPELAHQLVEAVPGLKLTLDPAHFAVIGYRQDEIERLASHAGHVHLRQARPGALQAKMEEGTLNFPAFFAALRDARYDGWLSIEYVNQNYMATLYDDVLSETVKMRDCFRAWSGKP